MPVPLATGISGSIRSTVGPCEPLDNTAWKTIRIAMMMSASLRKAPYDFAQGASLLRAVTTNPVTTRISSRGTGFWVRLAAASRTQNPVPLLLILVVTGFVVTARKSDAPWAKSYGAFLKLALIIIAIRIVFQAVLSSGSQGPTVLLMLPEIPVASGTGIKLGGVISLEAVLRAFYEGLQLATILCCVGAANSLGSARRLLRYVPGALYEIGVACVIALTFAPQLVTDAIRVRSAHRLRGQSSRGLGSLRRLAMPVLEGALERSIELAAAMDSRGYGRTTDSSRVSRHLTGVLVFGGLLGVCVGVYGLLAGTSVRWVGMPMLVAGCLLAAAGMYFGGRRTGRTKYRPDPWALPEWLVTGCGLVAAAYTHLTLPTI